MLRVVKGFVLSLAALAGGNAVWAGQVEIVAVEFQRSGGQWVVHTTLKHDDTGWDHYADGWRVVSADGKQVYGERTLFHPHEDEQPFTRSLSGVSIPSGIVEVFVEAHDKVHGWSPQRIKVLLDRASGDRFKVTR